VGAIVFVDTMFFAALTPLLPHLAHKLELSKAGAGILQAAYPLGTLVGAIPSGIVAARFGVKRTVIVGLLAIAVASIAFGLAGSEWELDTARFVQGLASSFSWTGGLAWLVAAAPSDRRGQLIGTALGVAIAGALMGPVLGGIASTAGTRVAFGAVAVIAIAQAIWAARTPSVPATKPQPVSILFHALRSRRVAAGFAFVLLPGLLFGTLSVLGPLRLSRLGFGSLAIGATWLIAAALAASINPFLGRISDRIGRRKPLLVALGASTLFLCVLPFPTERLLFAVVIVVADLAFDLFWTPAMSLLADGSEQRGVDYGWAFALLNLAWAPGQALGSLAGGTAAHLTSDRLVYLSLAGLCALTLVALWRSRSSS
jgi:MFS family permease